MDVVKNSIARDLTILFQDESDIPDRFRKVSKNKTNRIKKDAIIEDKFKEHISNWLQVIESILSNHKDEEQAWRFIKVSPNFGDVKINLVSQNNDFLDFYELLIERRDIRKCDDNELGKLAMLHSAFQKKIENYIPNEK